MKIVFCLIGFIYEQKNVPLCLSSDSGSSGSAGGLGRAAVERVAIKLEGQVEVILFPAVHPRSTQTGEEYQFVLGALDYFGDNHPSISPSSPLWVSPPVLL